MAMSTASFSMNQLMEKLKSADSDFRYMGLNDLMGMLQQESSLIRSDDVDRRLVPQVLSMLHDSHGEVQNMAVKTLSMLARCAREPTLLQIVDQLCEDLSHQTDSTRDISAVGLKALLAEFSESSQQAPGLVRHVTPRLMGLKDQPHDVLVELLDILVDVVQRFGRCLADKKVEDELVEMWFVLLRHPRSTVRKRCIYGIAASVAYTDDRDLGKLVERLHSEIASCTSVDYEKTLLQLLSQLGGAGGARISPFALGMGDLLLSRCGHEDDEVKEIAFQALEVVVTICPLTDAEEVAKLTAKCLEFIQYDPNYWYGDDDDEHGDPMDDGDDGDDDEIDSYSDDDDICWKVRRSAAKLFTAIVLNGSMFISQQIKTGLPVLIKCLREREQTVRIDLIAVIATIVKKLGTSGRGNMSTSSPRRETGAVVLSDGKKKRKSSPDTSTAGRMDVEDISDSVQFTACSGALITALISSIKRYPRSLECHEASFLLLGDIVAITGDRSGILVCLPEILLLVRKFVDTAAPNSATSNSLKLSALHLLHAVCQTLPTAELAPHIASLSDVLITCITERFYRVASEALLVASDMCGHYRTTASSSNVNPDAASSYVALYEAVFTLASASDVDPEVRESAIICLTALVCHTSDELQTRKLLHQQIFPLLMERLANETTRLIVLRRLFMISNSAPSVDFSTNAPLIMAEISGLLRKNVRALRLSALELAAVMAKRHAASLDQDLKAVFVSECSGLLVDTDLQLLSLTLRVLHDLLHNSSADDCDPMISAVMPGLLTLCHSAVVGGSPGTLTLLVSVFDAAASKSEPALVMDLLSKRAKTVARISHADAVALESISVCLAAVIMTGDISAANLTTTVKPLLQPLYSNCIASDVEKYLAFHLVGNLGSRGFDFHAVRIVNIMEDVIKELKNSSQLSEDLKAAAAFALGNLVAGSSDTYMSVLVTEFVNSESDGNYRHRLLSAIDQTISRFYLSSPSIERHRAKLWQLLINQASSAHFVSESASAVVAECLGKLALSNPPEFMLELSGRLAAQDATTQATIMTAIKYTLAEHGEYAIDGAVFDNAAQPVVERILATELDVKVQHISLACINTVLHNKPQLLRYQLAALLPKLFASTSVRQELITVVDMGPFKHKVDGGLDIRKCAYECIYSLLSTTLSLDTAQYESILDKIVMALKDPAQEIQSLAHLTLMKLSTKPLPHAFWLDNISRRQDAIVEPIRATLFAKQKETAVKQELEKHDELVRSALRCLLHVGYIVGLIKVSQTTDGQLILVAGTAGTTTQLENLLREVLAAPALAEHVKAAASDITH